jgi:hypothetical protein
VPGAPPPPPLPSSAPPLRSLAVVEFPRLDLRFKVRHSETGSDSGVQLESVSYNHSACTATHKRRENAQAWFVGATRMKAFSLFDFCLFGAKRKPPFMLLMRHPLWCIIACKVEFKGLVYVPSPPSAVEDLCRGIPHAAVLRDPAGEYAILVPATARPLRPTTKNELFSSTVLLDRRSKEWALQMHHTSGGGSSSSSGGGGGEARHFLYPVHGSLAFLFTPSLASSLFLLLMRFMNRQAQTNK